MLKGKEYFIPGETYHNTNTNKTFKCSGVTARGGYTFVSFRAVSEIRMGGNVIDHGMGLYLAQCQNFKRQESV